MTTIPRPRTERAIVLCGQTRLRYDTNALHHCDKEKGHDHPANRPDVREHTDGERTWEP